MKVSRRGALGGLGLLSAGLAVSPAGAAPPEGAAKGDFAPASKRPRPMRGTGG
jgi:hypothetical protein